MVRMPWPALLPSVLVAAGCLLKEPPTQLVPDNPFGAPAVVPPPVRTAYAPAALEVAARVDQVGRNLLASNPQLGVRPLFQTIGSPQPEIFHHGTSDIYITEGLVRQCVTDAQLAAVLSVQLGKMMSAREALASPWKRSQERELPSEVTFRSDNGADRTYLAELARYEKDRRRRVAPPPLPPDPQVLARTYLTNAGYFPGELETVAPLLRAAEANSAWEKQMLSPGPPRPWTRGS